MKFRLLQYCCRIWADALRADDKRPQLPPIVPVVFYQGERRWRHAREFAELFSEAVWEWPWTPRFQHLLVDQSQAAVGDVRGEALGQVAQLALMAAARRRVSQGRAALLMAAQYMGELAKSGRIELFGAIVRYVITTQDKETVREFGEALRRQVPGTGGDMKTYAEELLQEGLRKGRQEGRQEGQLGTIENFLQAGNRVVGHHGGYRYRPGSLPGAPPPARRVGSDDRVRSSCSRLGTQSGRDLIARPPQNFIDVEEDPQPSATSNVVTLRVSRLNSTPIRWIGGPSPRPAASETGSVASHPDRLAAGAVLVGVAALL